MIPLIRRKIVFLTGTRADFGKLKSLMLQLQSYEAFEVHVFVTGMHMLSRYGSTWAEVQRSGLSNIHFFFNQSSCDSSDQILAKTVIGFSDYIKELSPDMIVIHGDRIESLACASVGALNNILVSHIEGGEVSGTIDESIRHAVSKLSHLHFVANQQAKDRLIQLGEHGESIYVIGSPDVDIMNSPNLPTLETVQRHYGFFFRDYAIMIFHPVTSELNWTRLQVQSLVDLVIESGLNFVVLFPNNDPGSEIIISEYSRFENKTNISVYPSMRFEYFLTLLKNAKFIIGNSSTGVREAPHYGTPAINLGTRQFKRVNCPGVLEADFDKCSMRQAINTALASPRKKYVLFGSGNSADQFCRLLLSPTVWVTATQKCFVDLH